MKWTLVDSHGLDVVLKPLAQGRVFHALEKLQKGSDGLTQTSTRQVDLHRPGACRQSEAHKALLFLVREHLLGWNKAAERFVWTRYGKHSCLCHSGGFTKWS